MTSGVRDFTYDVCFSFANAQRPYVLKVVRALDAYGVRVFYDFDHEAELWGKNLHEHFDEIYGQQSRYCVLFISKDYPTRAWARYERQIAQARSFDSAEEYILPARFDDTEVPGLPRTVAYIDLRKYNPAQLADLIHRKLRAGTAATTFAADEEEIRLYEQASDYNPFGPPPPIPGAPTY